MQAIINQKFERLTKRFTKACVDAEIPGIVDGQAVLYQIVPSRSDQLTSYCYASLMYSPHQDYGAGVVQASYPLSGSCFIDCLQEGFPRILSSGQLSEPERKMFPNASDWFFIIPLISLYHPIGWLLVPALGIDDESAFWKAAFTESSLILDDALFSEIHTRIPNNLPGLSSHRELADLFGNLLDAWFLPFRYKFSDGEETIERVRQSHWGIGKDFVFSLALKTENKTFLVELRLWNRDIEDLVREAHLRKQAARLRSRLEEAFVAYSMLLAHRYEQFPLKRIQRLLNEIHNELAFVSKETALPPDSNETLHDFCFYSINSNWTIRFKGRTVQPPVNSQQGMHSIRLLLQSENQQIEPMALYEMLRDLGVTYKALSIPLDKDAKRLKISEYEDAIKSYYNKVTSDSISAKDELELWRQILEFAKALCRLDENKNDRYSTMITKAKEKIINISIVIGVDLNFQNPVSEILKEKDIITPKNAKDSINSGIKKVLEGLSKTDDELYQYLALTLIRTNNKGDDHKAFKYCPGLYTGNKPDLKHFYWMTEPPV